MAQRILKGGGVGLVWGLLEWGADTHGEFAIVGPLIPIGQRVASMGR